MKQNIILTICITYFFERDNIFNLFNSLKYIKEKEKIEILIRNDNPKIKIKKKILKILVILKFLTQTRNQ